MVLKEYGVMVSFKSLVLSIIRMQPLPKGYFHMGDFSGGTPEVISFLKNDSVVIGKYCSIANGVVMIPTVGHIPPHDYERYRVSTFPLARLKKNAWREEYSLPKEKSSIIVGNDVWIGARAIILSGVKIGDGAIVGAGAVVTHDVPPYAVVAGVPANIIRFRYPEEQIKQLLEIAWWNWSFDKVSSNMDLFYGEVAKFIKQFSKKP
jgi:acetyltransferase-like isoleucine patch superfamily enzyme